MRRPISRRSAFSKPPFSAPAASAAEISVSSSAISALGFELAEPFFQSCQALSELAHVISAVPRWSGSGRGPRRGACRGMRSTLGGLYCRRNLRVRCSEQPRDLLGQALIRRQACKLALPQIEITPGQPVEFDGAVVLVGSHGRTIAHRGCASRRQVVPQALSLLVALRYRR